MVALKFKKLRPEAELPRYETRGAAGMDIQAYESTVLQPGEWAVISTQLAVEIPFGWELQIRPRSGLAAKKAISIVNSPGTIDSDYRGELKVTLINHGVEAFRVQPGDRIAQLVLNEVPQAQVIEVQELSETARGAGGLGSTGV